MKTTGHFKHGMCYTKLYGCWAAMIQRCTNPKNKNHKYYYDKGITVCDEWLKFENFYEWAINNGYKEGLSIERKDNSKGYCPENCTWITMQEQARNKTNKTHIIIGGIDKSFAEWDELFEINKSTFYSRFKKANLKDNELIQSIREDKYKVFKDLFNHRLYHKSLIKFLPNNMLILQWLACYSISFDFYNAIKLYYFLNPILQYSLDHFYNYSLLVFKEIKKRKIDIDINAFLKLKENLLNMTNKNDFIYIEERQLYDCWMSTRYLLQCLMELEELYDVGYIKLDGWFKIVNGTRSMHVYCEETYQSLFV